MSLLCSSTWFCVFQRDKDSDYLKHTNKDSFFFRKKKTFLPGAKDFHTKKSGTPINIGIPEKSRVRSNYPSLLNWQVKWRISSASQVISRPRLISLRRSYTFFKATAITSMWLLVYTRRGMQRRTKSLPPKRF